MRTSGIRTSWDRTSGGPLFFGIFDTIVQWCNKSRSENMIKHYEVQKKIK